MQANKGHVNAEYVERLQLELERNPASRVFAPLVEAYRKLHLLDEALLIAEAGVARHHDFAAGRVAYAQVLAQKKRFLEAAEQLEIAIRLAPENLLAHSVLGEVYLQLRRPKEALKAFKMVMFLNPKDERARNAVKKWEFLTAEEYDSEIFSIQNLTDLKQATAATEKPNPSSDRIAQKPLPATVEINTARELERALSLADAFTIRNNIDSAILVLERAQKRLGKMPDIENRLSLLAKRSHNLLLETAEPIRPRSNDENVTPQKNEKKKKLESLLLRIQRKALDLSQA